MRYSGGLLGGTWLASLAGDLGNGTFDGARLVQNFERLNPSNTLWTKPYNLYSKVDTEEPRYLAFEKWWSGYFLTTKEGMRFITDELFVGKLTKGTIQTSDRRRIDLRNIRCPIVVLASWGDNITSPPQAMNWIPDLYETDDAIRAYEQVIVYTLDQRIGHLGDLGMQQITDNPLRLVLSLHRGVTISSNAARMPKSFKAPMVSRISERFISRLSSGDRSVHSRPPARAGAGARPG